MNQKTARRNYTVLKIFLAIVCAITAYWYVEMYGAPFKVTDPADPRFNPDRFKFRDYYDYIELSDAFRKLFPVGTPKKFVDQVLVKAGGAGAGQSQNYDKMWQYREPKSLRNWDVGPLHVFIYDQNMRLENIYVSGPPPLYPDRTTLEDLSKEYETNLKKQQGEVP